MSQAVSTVNRTVEVTGSLPFVTKAMAAKPIDPVTFDQRITETQQLAKALADAEGTVMWNLAVLTHNALNVSGFVGNVDKGARWATQGDYAKALGFSKSYMSRLVRLARAAMFHGIREGSVEWTFLASHASTAPFSTLCMGDDTKALKAAIKAAREGKELPAATRTAQPNDGTAANGNSEGNEGNGGTAATSEQPAQDWRDVLQMLPGIEAILHKADDEGANKVHAALLRMVAADKDRRRVLADKAKAAAAKAAKDLADAPGANEVPRTKAPVPAPPKSNGTAPQVTEAPATVTKAEAPASA